jgi:uncharacterized phage protein (TIGR02218 family)
MTFDAYENSVEDSRPVELYTIQLGALAWYYTSVDGIVTLDGIDYLPTPIERDSLEQSQEDQDQAMTVTMPAQTPICRYYITSVPGEQATVKIERYQIPDGGTPERIVMFEGAIQSVTFEGGGEIAKVTLQPYNIAFSRAVPKDVYSAVCNHVLYDVRCGLAEATYRTTQVVTAVTGNTLTIDNLDLETDGYYTAGFIELIGTMDFRVILAHVGEVVTIPLPFAISPLGTSVRVYAGCDHSPETCKSKFNNVANFGGFPFVPTKNPFQTGLK